VDSSLDIFAADLRTGYAASAIVIGSGATSFSTRTSSTAKARHVHPQPHVPLPAAPSHRDAQQFGHRFGNLRRRPNLQLCQPNQTSPEPWCAVVIPAFHCDYMNTAYQSLVFQMVLLMRVIIM
jgi:hypothetical protein